MLWENFKLLSKWWVIIESQICEEATRLEMEGGCQYIEVCNKIPGFGKRNLLLTAASFNPKRKTKKVERRERSHWRQITA
jgi:predicted enzyme involved in methoxymalonyl-ACP biosynthesis